MPAFAAYRAANGCSDDHKHHERCYEKESSDLHAEDDPGRGLAVEYRSVSGVECREGRKPVVRFADDGGKGEDEVVDLVVGADGIRSVVRKSLYGDAEGVRPVYL